MTPKFNIKDKVEMIATPEQLEEIGITVPMDNIPFTIQEYEEIDDEMWYYDGSMYWVKESFLRKVED